MKYPTFENVIVFAFFILILSFILYFTINCLVLMVKKIFRIKRDEINAFSLRKFDFAWEVETTHLCHVPEESKLNTDYEDPREKAPKDPLDEKLERLMNYGYNLCRGSQELKWKSKDLKKIGWRSEKNCFLIAYCKGNGRKAAIMNFLPMKSCKIPWQEPIVQNTMKKLLCNPPHRHLQQILKLDLSVELGCMVFVTPLEKLSLRDLIYKVKDPQALFNKKYQNNSSGKPINLEGIKKFGREILRALAVMHKMNWYHNNLHVGNIFIRDDEAIIGELQNYFLNTVPKDSAKLSQIHLFKGNLGKFESLHEMLDVIQFGHILYEMATGCELRLFAPDSNDYIFIPKQIGAILKQIFCESSVNPYQSINAKKMEDLLDIESVSRVGTGLEPPKLTIEELLYDDFFYSETFNIKDEIVWLSDQVTKSVLKQLVKLNKIY